MKRSRPRNQRVSKPKQRRQQHLLDVNVRSRSAAQHRNRKVLVFVSKFVLVIALATGVCLGARAGLRRFFFDNPDYRLTNIEFETDGTLPRDRALEVTDVHEGENIFHVDLAQVHDKLQELPQVDDVQVVRKLPNEIDIRVTERKPIAWITSEKSIADPFTSDAAFLVDARGVLMKEKKLLPEYLGLPLITGCTSETLAAGKIVESSEARAALELLRMSTRSFMQTRFQIREIDVSKGYCLHVTDKNRTQVTFAFENLETQLQRLEQFLIYSDDTKQELATVNLLVQRNIPVTFGKPAVDVINETIVPNEQPRVMKALPPDAPKFGTFSATKLHATASASPSPKMSIKRALPVEKGKKNTNGE